MEPFGLALSAGFFGFYAHCGVLTALVEADCVPVRGSGASAGALVLGFWAAGMGIEEMGRELMKIRRQDFWDPFPGLGLLRGKRFRRRLEEMLPVRSFEECRVPLAVSTFDGLARRSRVLSTGSLARAIHASCAVPFLFQPVWIGCRPHWDGGIRDRPGLAGMPETERVLYHHLVPRSSRRGRAPPGLPHRAGMTTLLVDDLPRCGPNRLDRGSVAFHAAVEATRRALSFPVENGIVRVRV